MPPVPKETMRCHYEVLELDRLTCTVDDIKKQYKKSALKWHPDRNIGNLEEANIRFKEVGAAYAVLIDPHERKWYDDHRDAILRGSNGTRANRGDDDEDNGDVADLWEYFSSSCFEGFEDDECGFYAVYRDAFAEVVTQENAASEKLVNFPEFGDSTMAHKSVLHFYSEWSNFASVLSFSWEDEYNPSEASDRRVRREIDKLNKKARDAARRKYMDQVLQLVAFVRKRDPRIAAIEEIIAGKKAEEAARKEKLKQEEVERRKLEREKYLEMLNDPVQIALREAELKGAYLIADHSGTDESDDGAWGEIGGKVRRGKKKGLKGRKGRRAAIHYSDSDSDDNEGVAVPMAKLSVGAEDADDGLMGYVGEGSADVPAQKVATEVDLEPFKCELCGKGFTHNKFLDQHNNSKAHKQAIKDSKRKGGVNFVPKTSVKSESTLAKEKQQMLALGTEARGGKAAPSAATTVYNHETNTSTSDVRTFVEKMLGGDTSRAAVQKQMAKQATAAAKGGGGSKDTKTKWAEKGGKKDAKKDKSVFTLRGAKGLPDDEDSDGMFEA